MIAYIFLKFVSTLASHSCKPGLHVWQHPASGVSQFLTTGFAMSLAIKSWKNMVSVKCRSAATPIDSYSLNS